MTTNYATYEKYAFRATAGVLFAMGLFAGGVAIAELNQTHQEPPSVEDADNYHAAATEALFGLALEVTAIGAYAIGKNLENSRARAEIKSDLA